MKIIYLGFKNVIHSPLKSTFNILLVSLSIGLILTTILIQEQYKNHIEKNLAKVDLILGAKGSPLQSVLCNLYQIDFPTGNIDLQEIKPFLNKAHPIIKESLPISLGDNFGGFRIVGTTLEFMPWYSLKLEEGRLFQINEEAVLGSEVARKMKMSLGSTFVSGHGLLLESESKHDHGEMKVVGILKATGTVSDQLIFVPISSYWFLHKHEEDENSIPHADPVVLQKDSLTNESHTITSLLLRFKGNSVQSLNFGRSINENTKIMAASPALELNRIYEITGSATELLNMIAFIIAILAIFSIVLSLFQALHDRKLELALIRLLGGNKSDLLLLILTEGLIIIILGLVLGFFGTHSLLEWYSAKEGLQVKYGIYGFYFAEAEWWIILASIIFGFISCLLPAILAYKQNIHQTLKEN